MQNNKSHCKTYQNKKGLDQKNLIELIEYRLLRDKRAEE